MPVGQSDDVIFARLHHWQSSGMKDCPLALLDRIGRVMIENLRACDRFSGRLVWFASDRQQYLCSPRPRSIRRGQERQPTVSC